MCVVKLFSKRTDGAPSRILHVYVFPKLLTVALANHPTFINGLSNISCDDIAPSRAGSVYRAIAQNRVLEVVLRSIVLDELLRREFRSTVKEAAVTVHVHRACKQDLLHAATRASIEHVNIAKNIYPSDRHGIFRGLV